MKNTEWLYEEIGNKSRSIPKNMLHFHENKFMSIINGLGYKDNPAPFNKIKLKTKKQKENILKYADTLLKLYDETKEFYLFVIRIGEKPLYSKKTKALAKAACKKLAKGNPFFYKLERYKHSDELHIHVIILAPKNTYAHSPKKVNNFHVEPYMLLNKKYPEKTLEEGMRQYMSYLLKPADSRVYGNDRERYEMYREWYAEQIYIEKTGKSNWDSVQLWGFHT